MGLFREQGFDDVSVDAICEQAGASKMTFYRQFDDKKDFCVKLVEKVQREAKVLVEEILSRKAPFSEKFKAVMELNERVLEMLGVKFVEEVNSNPEKTFTDRFQEVGKQMEELNIRFIELGKSEGFLNPKFKVEFILLIVQWFDKLFKAPELGTIYPNYRDRIRMMEDFFYYGISAKRD